MIKNLFINFSFFLFLTVIALLAAGCPKETFDAPTGLTATATGKIITLSWNAVKGAGSYLVYGSFTSGGPFVYIGSTNYGTAFYVTHMDERGSIPLEPNTTYYFKVSVYDSELSSEVSATTGTW
jgi:hypothetical protein